MQENLRGRVVDALRKRLERLKQENLRLTELVKELDTTKGFPSHWRLGISFEGIFLFLTRINFFNLNSGCADEPEYASSYQRGEDMQWANASYGPIEREQNGTVTSWTMTGYDLCSFLRNWQAKKGHQRLSVCKIVLTDSCFQDLRHHVGATNVFYSHIQSVDPLETFLMLKFARNSLETELPEQQVPT